MKKIVVLLLVTIIMAVALTGCAVQATCKITFDSMGGSVVAPIEGKVGAPVTAPNVPTRAGYEFAGWYNDREYTSKHIFTVMSDHDITLYAKWIQTAFDITLNGMGGSGTNITSYEQGEEVTLPTDWTREGYRFAGWYENEEYTSNEIKKIDAGSTGARTFYAKWVKNEPNTYLVTLNGNGGTGTALDSYKKGENTALPTDWTRTGYTFAGWYDGADFAKATKHTNIGPLVRGDKTFYAKWEPIIYTIHYVTNGGVSIDDQQVPCGGTIEEKVPFYADMIFDGWYTNTALTDKFVDTIMPAHDITLYAKWSTGYTVKYYSQGKVVSEDIYQKETITLLNPLYYSFNEPDYYFDGWYTDSAFMNRAGDTLNVTKSTNLYAKWTHRSFLPYLDRFEAKSSALSPIVVNSRRELIALLDYVMYKGVGETYFKVAYKSDSAAREKEFKDCYQNLMTNAIVPGLLYSNHGGSIMVEIPTGAYTTGYKVMPGQNKAKKQMKNALVPVPPKTRSNAFDDFAYKKYKDLLNVETSNQLFYTLQVGAQPIVKKGSVAERMMNKAKSILREICDDSMSDFEKLYAIFCYMTENVLYDDVAATHLNDPAMTLNEYDSWHLEGVFDHQMAVCDGIAKAVTVLARIEGIPCIRVVSDVHAWNKVYVDVDGNGVREWYNLDATWGSLDIGGSGSAKEGFDSEQFLFMDSYTESINRTATNQLDIKADTLPDFHQNIYFETAGQKYDLVIEDMTELNVLAKYIHDFVNMNNISGGDVVISVKQTVKASTKDFNNALYSAMIKENNKKFGDIDPGVPSFVPRSYTALIVFPT